MTLFIISACVGILLALLVSYYEFKKNKKEFECFNNHIKEAKSIIEKYKGDE